MWSSPGVRSRTTLRIIMYNRVLALDLLNDIANIVFAKDSELTVITRLLYDKETIYDIKTWLHICQQWDLQRYLPLRQPGLDEKASCLFFMKKEQEARPNGKRGMRKRSDRKFIWNRENSYSWTNWSAAVMKKYHSFTFLAFLLLVLTTPNGFLAAERSRSKDNAPIGILFSGCWIPLDTTVNEYHSQIAVIISDKRKGEHIVSYSVL